LVANIVSVDVHPDKVLKYFNGISPTDILRAIVTIIIVALFLVFICCIIALFRGSSVKIGPLKFDPNQKINELTNAYKDIENDFKELRAESSQKGQWLELQFRINHDILYIRSSYKKDNEIDSGIAKLLDFALPSLISIITTDRDNSLRAAVFIPDERFLKILEGSGFSVEETETLKLPESSVAGQAFTQNKEIYIPDVMKSEMWFKNPHAIRTYHTLYCVPICFNDHRYAILNVDAEKVDSFNKDDKAGIKLMASSLAIMFYVREAAKNKNG
jgi:hypothetical protein